MTALSVNHINKYFYEPVNFHVLKDISFEIKTGEFVAIMGKSGSGKSTLLYLLSTMDTDYEGTITINGTRITGLKQNQLAAFRNEHIGFVFQFHFLLSEFSVLDNIMLPALKLKKKSKDEIEYEAMELIKLLDIQGQELKRPHKFQGGNSNG
jgi:lipoprotein-releasing system ATP-binding protein